MSGPSLLTFVPKHPSKALPSNSLLVSSSDVFHMLSILLVSGDLYIQAATVDAVLACGNIPNGPTSTVLLFAAVEAICEDWDAGSTPR